MPESVRGLFLLLVVGPGGLEVCFCGLSHRERPEAINGFKSAIENYSAFLLF